jgi:hypothetical protein
LGIELHAKPKLGERPQGLGCVELIKVTHPIYYMIFKALITTHCNVSICFPLLNPIIKGVTWTKHSLTTTWLHAMWSYKLQSLGFFHTFQICHCREVPRVLFSVFSCTKRKSIIDKWKQKLFAQFEDNLDDDNGEELSLLKALDSNFGRWKGTRMVTTK